MGSWHVYFLRCGDDTLYAGATTDLQRRLAAHQKGRGAAYTRSRRPVALVYSEAVEDRSAALRREAALKRLSRDAKLELVARSSSNRESDMTRGQKPYFNREPRSEIRVPTSLFFDGAQIEAELVNVSLSGGFLRVADPPGLRTVLALAMLPPVGEPIYFHAMVIRGESSGCAVKFLNLSPESEGRLAYLIKKQASSLPPK